MSSAVAELDGYLQSMLALKPPGVSGTKITSITSLCMANVQSESVLIQKIYTHFKKAPATHKLGVLYVVDSVTRQWVDQTRKAGQQLGTDAPDGTCAAGVNRVTALLPVIMNDIITTAPEDQKDKIKKLLTIWERSCTFPAPMLTSFNEKLNASASQNVESTTPEGSPAPSFIPLRGPQQSQQPQQQQQAPAGQAAAMPDTTSILKALADMAKQNTTAPATSGAAAQTSPNSVLSAPSAVPQVPTSTVDQTAQQQLQQQTNGQAAVNPFASNLASQLAGFSNAAAQNPNMFQNQTQPAGQPANPLAMPAQNPLAALLPQAAAAAPASTMPTPDAMQQLGMLQLLAAQGIPQDQWATALQILNFANQANTGGMGNVNPAALAAAFGGQQPQQQPPNQNAWGAPMQDTASRDHGHERDREYMRSPPGGYRRRSRSPGWDRRREVSPPRRRDSPVYGEYHGDSPGRNRTDPRDARGRRPDGYRQRSPPGRRRRSPSPQRKDSSLPPPGPKVLEWDYSIGQGNIKVLSRTLFVGGVTSSEAHLRSLFGRFGVVQTCIVNTDKRHAFVKMINRPDAVNAREGMEQYKSGDMQLRTRWGVGFGPRDCSDYQTGVSIIPIERLTDADRKWMLTAEYGGTGGKSIESGMVVEEPDIEIGAGVSSKAISRRMATDQGGKRGPISSRAGFGGAPRGGGGGGGGPEHYRRDHHHRMDHDSGSAHSSGGAGGAGDRSGDNSANSNPNAIGVPPAVPGFGFQFPGIPMFPSGFMLGAAAGAQTGSSSSTPTGQQQQQQAPGQGS
ncbi:hypothetical protein AJ80_02778 [Polytolypa hystricis UAMH7299]|uniref:CID domain-containing protein n=1 Tax=Polytolypa hystricis (strain UAMH7299) TaxID=1447883 RepID=A0A2B7YR99_POLH7|nr:hypothetical protein AJ80_02778 [Polytolypa hystricis UAMH7299]